MYAVMSRTRLFTKDVYHTRQPAREDDMATGKRWAGKRWCLGGRPKFLRDYWGLFGWLRRKACNMMPAPPPPPSLALPDRTASFFSAAVPSRYSSPYATKMQKYKMNAKYPSTAQIRHDQYVGRKSPLATKNLLEVTNGLRRQKEGRRNPSVTSRCGSPLLSADVLLF